MEELEKTTIHVHDEYTDITVKLDEGPTADDLVHAFATVMLGLSYEYASIIDAFETYAQEHRFNTKEVMKEQQIDCE